MALNNIRDQLQIVGFQTYGTDGHFYARGRALVDEEIDLAEKGWFQLLKNTYKRFETDEVKHTAINITFPDGRIVGGMTDNDGYYLIDIPIDNLAILANQEGWLSYEISYADPLLPGRIKLENRFPGELLIPDENASFGVISDIDDTILHTGVATFLKWRALFNTFFKNVSTRIPLKGAAEFYHQLHRGRAGNAANPIFYVSNGPWNLYRYLEFFLKKNLFPKGPILLRSMGATLGRRRTEKPHKAHEIENILKTYASLQFILIGDSGEHDADIYKEIAEQYPGRILAIYLRNVGDKKRMNRLKTLFENFKEVPVLFADHSEEAVSHARSLGLI
tara:strand:+ start:977 stop:1978 length:1002 start_codon:yes stop_codon:yes gene_type:complete